MFRKTWVEKIAKHFVSKRCHFHATSLEEHFSPVIFDCCLWKQTAPLRRQALESPHKQLKLNSCRRTCDKNVTLHHVRNIDGHIHKSNTVAVNTHTHTHRCFHPTKKDISNKHLVQHVQLAVKSKFIHLCTHRHTYFCILQCDTLKEKTINSSSRTARIN